MSISFRNDSHSLKYIIAYIKGHENSVSTLIILLFYPGQDEKYYIIIPAFISTYFWLFLFTLKEIVMTYQEKNSNLTLVNQWVYRHMSDFASSITAKSTSLWLTDHSGFFTRVSWTISGRLSLSQRLKLLACCQGVVLCVLWSWGSWVL